MAARRGGHYNHRHNHHHPPQQQHYQPQDQNDIWIPGQQPHLHPPQQYHNNNRQPPVQPECQHHHMQPPHEQQRHHQQSQQAPRSQQEHHQPQQQAVTRSKILEVFLPANFQAWSDLTPNPLLGQIADPPLSEMKKEDFPFYCDSCQKGFFSQKKYDEHMDTHLWCEVEGCNFTTTSQWKMDLHMEMLHNRPDAPDLRDTEKYLEARRNKYPTKEAVDAKVEELYYKSAKGEILPDERRRWLRQHGVHIRKPKQEYVYVPITRFQETNNAGVGANKGGENGGEGAVADEFDGAYRKRKEITDGWGDVVAPEKRDRKEKMLPKGVDGRYTRAQQVQLVKDKYRDAKFVPKFYVCTRCGEKGVHWVTNCPTIGDEKYDRNVIWAHKENQPKPQKKEKGSNDNDAPVEVSARGPEDTAAQKAANKPQPPPPQPAEPEQEQVPAAPVDPSNPSMKRHVPRRRIAIPTRDPSLYDKLVEDDRLGDKGLLLQAFRYFTRTNFLQGEYDDPSKAPAAGAPATEGSS